MVTDMTLNIETLDACRQCVATSCSEVIILQWMRICTHACVGMNQGPYLGSILCYMFQQATFRSTMLTHLADFNVCTRMMQSRSKLCNARVEGEHITQLDCYCIIRSS